MNFNKVRAVYFSATGTTKKIVGSIAGTIAGKLGIKYDTCDFTLPNAREKALRFHESDIVVFGTPIYAGRVPNVLLKYLNFIEGNDAIAVPVVLYGNRDYDDALIELRDILEKVDCILLPRQRLSVNIHFHMYWQRAGRMKDMQRMNLRRKQKIKASPIWSLVPVEVNRYYHLSRIYQPRDRDGNPIDIRKVKPLTGDNFINCLICADVCPMGSISRDNVRELPHCIVWGMHKMSDPGKYYVDEGYLYHKRELEEGLTRRAEPEWFV